MAEKKLTAREAAALAEAGKFFGDAKEGKARIAKFYKDMSDRSQRRSANAGPGKSPLTGSNSGSRPARGAGKPAVTISSSESRPVRGAGNPGRPATVRPVRGPGNPGKPARPVRGPGNPGRPTTAKRPVRGAGSPGNANAVRPGTKRPGRGAR